MICFGGIWGLCEERGECQWGSTTQTHGDEWYLHLCTTGLGVLGRFFGAITLGTINHSPSSHSEAQQLTFQRGHQRQQTRAQMKHLLVKQK